MPELNSEQIKAFKRVSKKRHLELKDAVEKRVGRPKKNINEKENVISIRLSKSFLDKLKKKAKQEGFEKWQTYAKHVIEENIK